MQFLSLVCAFEACCVLDSDHTLFVHSSFSHPLACFLADAGSQDVRPITQGRTVWLR